MAVEGRSRPGEGRRPQGRVQVPGRVTTPEERNALVRTVFRSREVARFFILLDSDRKPCGKDEGQPTAAQDRHVSSLVGGSDGIRTRDLSLDRAAC